MGAFQYYNKINHLNINIIVICFDVVRGVSKDTQALLIANQLTHIESMLIAARSANHKDVYGRRVKTWLVVCGHYPVFSVGSHGDTDELQVSECRRTYNSGDFIIMQYLISNNK